MHDDNELWETVWRVTGTVLGLLVLVIGTVSYLNNHDNRARDEYYAAHCKVVTEHINSGSSATRTYTCK